MVPGGAPTDAAAPVRVTAYGRAALDALAAEVAAVKHADPLAPVTILAPATIAGILARRHLAAGVGGRPGIAGLTVTTLDRLAEHIAAPRLAPARPASTPIVAAAWRAALAADPRSFGPVADHPATIRALVRAHTELRDLDAALPGAGADPLDRLAGADPLDRLAGADPLDRLADASPLAADLVALHRRVRAAMRTRFYDRTDLLLAATAAVADALAPTADWGTVLLYLPQDLSLAQAGFARAVAERAPMRVLAGLTGVQRADSAVRRSLRRLGLAEPAGAPPPPTARRIRHASDSDDEVRGAVREVLAALGRHPAHRIAVLYAARVPYARLLHEHLAQAGIAINGPGTVPVAERALPRALLGLLDLAGTDLPRAELFRVLADAPAFDHTGARVPLSRWERVSRLAGVVAGDDWAHRLDAYGAGQRATIDTENARDEPSVGRIEAAQRQIDAATGLRDFVTALRDTLDEGAALTDWPSLTAWALTLLRRTYRGDLADADADVTAEVDGGYARLPVEEQYAAAVVEQVLGGLAGLAEFEPVTDVAALRDTLAIALESALPRVGQLGDGVLVAPLSAAVGLDADEILVVGLAEDLYPGRMHPDPLLPDEVRAAIDGALPATRDALDARQRHLLAAFAAAPAVTASFPRGDLRRSTTRLPSRWLLPTLRELAGNTELAATNWESARSPAVSGAASHAAELLGTEQLATEQDWRIRAVASGQHLGDAVLDAAVTMTRARAATAFTRFDGNLTGAAGLPDFTDGSRRVSPTRLESYAECPHAYFVQRMLRVEPLEQPEQTISISPIDIGNLMHASMDRLVRRCGDDLPGYGEPWSPEQRGLLAEIAAELATEYETGGATGHPLLWERERRRILADLQRMLDDDDAWRAGADAQVLASELAFGTGGIDPVAVPLPDGGHLLMVGSADKVDRARDGTLLVTDIKTGSARRYTDISHDNPVVGGTRLQLPVYAHAARARLGDGATTPVLAQYWFVRRDRGKRIGLDLDEHVEAVYAAALQTLASSIAGGLFPAKAPEGEDFAWVQCPYCNPDGIGHAEVRERWERKRDDPALADLVALIDPDAAEIVGGDEATGPGAPGRRASGARP